MSSHHITSVETLRGLYELTRERSAKKERPELDRHGRHFIALSPLVVVSTHSALASSPGADAPLLCPIVGRKPPHRAQPTAQHG